MSNWNNFSIKVPTEVSSFGSLLKTSLDTFTNALEVFKTTLSLTQAAAIDPTSTELNLLNQGIQTSVQAIKALLDQFLLSTGCYVLLIPIPKKTLIDPQSVDDDADRNLVNPSYFPLGPFLQNLPAAQRARLYEQIDFAHLFDPTANNLGGNAYLIRTLAESLFDSGDVQRPRWQNSMYWGTCEIVIGAVDYTQITNILLYIDNLFSNISKHQNLNRSQLSLVPSTLNAVVAYPETSSKPSVVVSWPTLNSGRILSSFESATLIPVRMAIIRSTDFRARNALRVSDLFSAPLTTGLTGQYGAKVLFEGDFDGITNRYIDNGPFEEGKDYYYHVAFKTRLQMPGTAPTTNDYTALSPTSAIHFTARLLPPLSTSKPPDWTRTPSITNTIPPLSDFLTKVKIYLDSFIAGSQSFTDRQSAYLAFIDKQIVKFETQATEISDNIQSLIQIFNISDTAGAYVRFGNGQGTVGDFLADFITSLTNSDDNRPPFDNGTEFTAALIFLSAGPDPSQVEASLALLQTLLNPTVSNPIQTVLTQINQVVATAEQSVLDQLNSTVTSSNTFASDGTPLPPGTPDPNCS